MRSTSQLLVHVVLASAACFALPSPVLAQAKDAQAQKLEREAMDNDYLATDFASAEKKLNEALKVCGAKACSNPVRARIHVSLGVVQGGQGKLAEAKAQFVSGLEVDPTVELDKDLATPELKTAFEEAKSQVLGALSVEEVVLEEIAHTPPTEQALHTPLPIFVVVPEGINASRVQLRYRAPGADDFKSMNLPKLDTGFGGNVPCRDLTQEGVLVYYVQALDETGAVVMTAGTLAQPFRVRIREEITSEPPHLPGKEAPEACVKPKPKVAPPPEEETIFPPCDSSRDCEMGMYCNAKHRCEMRTGDESEDEIGENSSAFGKAKRSWVTVSFAMDIAHTSGTDVCTLESQRDNYFACFQSNGDAYNGTPILGRADDIQSGMALATMRALVGYDHLVLPNLTVGGRVGYAFNGSPTDFLPFHADARVAFYLGKDPFARAGVRPFVFAVGGIMQVDTKVPVEVWEEGGTAGCIKPGGCKIDLDAWRRAGNAFAGLGIGAQYAVTEAQALVLSVRGAYLFPASAAVITPEIGFTTGF